MLFLKEIKVLKQIFLLSLLFINFDALTFTLKNAF